MIIPNFLKIMGLKKNERNNIIFECNMVVVKHAEIKRIKSIAKRRKKSSMF